MEIQNAQTIKCRTPFDMKTVGWKGKVDAATSGVAQPARDRALGFGVFSFGVTTRDTVQDPGNPDSNVLFLPRVTPTLTLHIDTTRFGRSPAGDPTFYIFSGLPVCSRSRMTLHAIT